MQHLNQDRGFSLLEVLVSMLIIMIGALGIAGMQFFAITSTENARYQNVATMLGTSLAASMQGNVLYWGTPPALTTFNGTTITGGPPAFTGDCKGAANVCNRTQMAAYDLTQWTAQVANQLPSGTATIACPSGNSPAICTVTLSWLERNISLNNTTGSETDTDMQGGAKKANTYQTLVSIL